MQNNSFLTLYILGHNENQETVTKLPLKGQVLRFLLYNLKKRMLDLEVSAQLVVEEVEVLWKKAGIPVQESSHSINKLKILYQEWEMIRKYCKRKKPEQQFLGDLNDLFDIAHDDALRIISRQERKFLMNQRRHTQLTKKEQSMIGGYRRIFEYELRMAKNESRVTRRRAAIQKETIAVPSPDEVEKDQQIIENPVLESTASNYNATVSDLSDPSETNAKM
ncbi:uncharacterized protein LOC117227936 [Megalopta genalis]|uniref:uncharacterized protein LOC117227936 n=1 Tax=Megalopta genalis TaxID=115081 RepID=UPI003FD405EB